MTIEELKKYVSGTITVNDDGSIDVDGDVIMYNLNLTKIPFKFSKVTGIFSVKSFQ